MCQFLFKNTLFLIMTTKKNSELHKYLHYSIKPYRADVMCYVMLTSNFPLEKLLPHDRVLLRLSLSHHISIECVYLSYIAPSNKQLSSRAKTTQMDLWPVAASMWALFMHS